MPREWMDVSHLSFNTLLLLEQVQLSWLPGWLPESDLRIALRANPTVEWFFRHKCPQINEWLDRVISMDTGACSPVEIRQAEISVLSSMTDLIIYAVDPSVYDAQPFLRSQRIIVAYAGGNPLSMPEITNTRTVSKRRW